ncbi:MAG: UDP-2,3-diacylglucosamine diphosphatase [Thermofilaceae archaeon]
MKIEIVTLDSRKVPLVKLEEGDEAVIVSDLHFGLRYKGRFLTKFKEFENFLRHLAGKPPSLLILLGDVFELWSAKAKDVFATAYASLRELAKLDCKMIYVAGNHDHVVAHLDRMSFFENDNLLISPEYIVLESSGLKGLLFHGHQLDWKFIRFKWLWRTEPYIYLLSESLSALPWSTEWILAVGYALLFLSFISITSRAPLSLRFVAVASALLLTAPFIILSWRKIQDKFWYGLVQPLTYQMFKSRLRGKALKSEPVSKALRNLLSLVEESGLGNTDFVIFGHTHVPGLHEVEKGRIVANTGSWIEDEEGFCCTFVKIKDRKITLTRWNGSAGENLMEITL